MIQRQCRQTEHTHSVRVFAESCQWRRSKVFVVAKSTENTEGDNQIQIKSRAQTSFLVEHLKKLKF